MTETPTPTSDAPVSPEAPVAAPAPASTVLTEGAPTSPPAAADASPPPAPDAPAAPADAPAGGEPAPSTEAPADPTPIVYDLKVPDGVTIDAPAFTAFTTLATESKLVPEVAQSLLTQHAEALKASQTAQIAAAQAQFQETQDAWKAEVKALPEFSTEAATKTSMQSIGRMMDEFGTPEVKSILDATGAGNNPHLVSMFLKMANALTEGRPTTAPNAAPPSKGKPNGTLSYPTIPQ